MGRYPGNSPPIGEDPLESPDFNQARRCVPYDFPDHPPRASVNRLDFLVHQDCDF